MRDDEKQLHLDDYIAENNKKKDKIKSNNKIQLYQAEKMMNFCKNKHKVHLKLT